MPVATWIVPLSLELGSVYLQPEQKQFVCVLFEDRSLTAEDGWTADDFTGVDLYQQYGSER